MKVIKHSLSLTKPVCTGILILLVAGCANTKIGKLEEYQPVDMAMTEFPPPAKHLEGVRSKIAVRPMSEATDVALGRYISEQIVGELNSLGNVDVVMIPAATRNSKANANAVPADADYVIDGSVNSFRIVSSFSDSYTYKNKDGGTEYVPARCNYSGEVKATVRVFAKNSDKPTFIYTDTSTGNGPEKSPSGRTCRNLTGDEANEVYGRTGDSFVKDIKNELKSDFAPVGYVKSRFKSPSSANIFLTSLGSSMGAKEGLQIEFFTIRKVVDPLSKATSLQRAKIAEGVVSDQVAPGQSYVIIKEQIDADTIRTGDIVKGKFTGGFFQDILPGIIK